MILEDGLKLVGRPAEIPDASRDELPEFFKRQGFMVGVEVGVYMGMFTERLAESGLQIYGVDPWQVYADYDYGDTQRRQDNYYQEAVRRLDGYPNCTIIRKPSMEAVKDFEDGSLDFVYIDGNHRFNYVIDDIREWSKKVKKGGIISGHDYWDEKVKDRIQVRSAVNAYAKEHNINFWVLGCLKSHRPDHWRSWMWLNP